MTQAKRTEAIIDAFIAQVSVNGTNNLCPTVLNEIHGLRDHARDLAQKLDAVKEVAESLRIYVPSIRAIVDSE